MSDNHLNSSGGQGSAQDGPQISDHYRGKYGLPGPKQAAQAQAEGQNQEQHGPGQYGQPGPSGHHGQYGQGQYGQGQYGQPAAGQYGQPSQTGQQGQYGQGQYGQPGHNQWQPAHHQAHQQPAQQYQFPTQQAQWPHQKPASKKLGMTALILAIAALVLGLVLTVWSGVELHALYVRYGTKLPTDVNAVPEHLKSHYFGGGIAVLAQISPTALGITALIMGIRAISRKAGRGAGITAVVVAAAAPIFCYVLFSILLMA